jgi:hypothetical protein
MENGNKEPKIMNWSPVIRAVLPLALVVLAMLAFVYMGYSN